jgi:hypothetical protein
MLAVSHVYGDVNVPEFSKSIDGKMYKCAVINIDADIPNSLNDDEVGKAWYQQVLTYQPNAIEEIISGLVDISCRVTGKDQKDIKSWCVNLLFRGSSNEEDSSVQTSSILTLRSFSLDALEDTDNLGVIINEVNLNLNQLRSIQGSLRASLDDESSYDDAAVVTAFKKAVNNSFLAENIQETRHEEAEIDETSDDYANDFSMTKEKQKIPRFRSTRRKFHGSDPSYSSDSSSGFEDVFDSSSYTSSGSKSDPIMYRNRKRLKSE